MRLPNTAHTSSMGELVDHLEQRGYVERRPDPRDRRAKIVVSTEKGRRGIKAAAERIAEIEAELAVRMGKEGLEELIGLLAELRRNPRARGGV